MTAPADQAEETVQISLSEIAQLSGTLASVKNSLELLSNPDLPIPDIAKGVVIGTFVGVPRQLRRAQEILRRLVQE
jgi:hypothetical protein